MLYAIKNHSDQNSIEIIYIDTDRRIKTAKRYTENDKTFVVSTLKTGCIKMISPVEYFRMKIMLFKDVPFGKFL